MSPLKSSMPQKIITANFGHPVSKSLLKPCMNELQFLSESKEYLLQLQGSLLTTLNVNDVRVPRLDNVSPPTEASDWLDGMMSDFRGVIPCVQTYLASCVIMTTDRRGNSTGR